MKKIFLILTALLFTICTISLSSAAELTNKQLPNVKQNTTDQFTPNQNDGRQTNLKDSDIIPENVKNRIRELSDTKPETKGGTVIEKNLRPSVNRQTTK